MFGEHNTPPGSAVHKTFKRTGRPLVVPLPPAARAVVERLAAEHLTGPLFRTAGGLPWTNSRLPGAVNRAAKKVGLAGRFMAYSCRHTFATAKLEAGQVDGEGKIGVSLLRSRMNAGVGAAGALHPNGGVEHAAEGGLEDGLHCRGVGLRLPSGVTRSKVLKREENAHGQEGRLVLGVVQGCSGGRNSSSTRLFPDSTKPSS